MMRKKLTGFLLNNVSKLLMLSFATLITTWFLALNIKTEGFDTNFPLWGVALVTFLFQLGSFTVFRRILDTYNWQTKFFLTIGYVVAIILLIYFEDAINYLLQLIFADEIGERPLGSFAERAGNFLDWFFEPAKHTEFYYYNFYILFILLNVLSAVVLFYYTQVFFRISVMFLFSLLPPVLFAKDYRDVSTVLLIAVFALFFCIIVHSRQMKKQKGIRVITNRSYAASVIAFLGFALVLAIFVPKPEIVNKRKWFDWLTTEYFSTRYGTAIDRFTSVSSENKSTLSPSDDMLFLVSIKGNPCNLKAYSLTEYDYESNEWHGTEQDQFKPYRYNRLCYNEWTKARANLNPAFLANKIRQKCIDDPEYAKAHGLEGLAELPEADTGVQLISVCYMGYDGEFVLSTPTTYDVQYLIPFGELSLDDFEIVSTESGRLIPLDIHSKKYSIELPSLSVEKITAFDKSVYQESAVRYLIDNLNSAQYSSALSDADATFSNNDIYDAYFYEYQRALLDYSDNSIPDTIVKLAKEITADCKTDYEKALALRDYFTETGYKYDLSYSLPPSGIENFIFEEKRGSCFHYATAMTLMARALGLPARYCEGFSMEPYVVDSEGYSAFNCAIFEKNSHAFCEVYVSGAGWMSFDPTVSAEESDFGLGSARLALFVLTLVLSCGALSLCIIYIFVPLGAERLLRRRVRTLAGERSVRLVMLRLRKRHLRLSPSLTTEQTRMNADELYSADISELCRLFDMATYGDCKLDKAQAERAYNDYLMTLRKIKETKRARRKARRRKLFKSDKKAPVAENETE